MHILFDVDIFTSALWRVHDKALFKSTFAPWFF